MVQGQRQLKDIPVSTCLNTSERIELDLNGLGPRFNTHWGNILLLIISFLHSKASDANIAIIANFVCF